MLIQYVQYRRVSTRAQGQSGLGLEAQNEACTRFIKANGGEIVASFTDIETGKSSERPELAKAITLCKHGGYTLLVSKLDRLARNLHFITTLEQSKVPFRAVDNPWANQLVIHIMSAISQAEAVAIATRTREALRQCKLRGVKLGAPAEALDKARKVAQKAVQEQKQARYLELIKPIRDIQSTGVSSYNAIADALNRRGYTTMRKKQFTAVQVRRIVLAS